MYHTVTEHLVSAGTRASTIIFIELVSTSSVPGILSSKVLALVIAGPDKRFITICIATPRPLAKQDEMKKLTSPVEPDFKTAIGVSDSNPLQSQ